MILTRERWNGEELGVTFSSKYGIIKKWLGSAGRKGVSRLPAINTNRDIRREV